MPLFFCAPVLLFSCFLFPCSFVPLFLLVPSCSLFPFLSLLVPSFPPRQVISLLEHLAVSEDIRGPFLAVVPLSTVEHWRREIERWTDLKVCVYHDQVSPRSPRSPRSPPVRCTLPPPSRLFPASLGGFRGASSHSGALLAVQRDLFGSQS